MSEAEGIKEARYSSYVYVWLGLVALTIATVYLARGGAKPGLIVPLAIATAKAALVLYFFMHLRRERALVRSFVLIAAGIAFVLTWLVFTDVFYR